MAREEALPDVLARLLASDLCPAAMQASWIAEVLIRDREQDQGFLMSILEGYQAEAAALRAELRNVRFMIQVACEGRSAPSTSWILACLYPTPEMIAAEQRKMPA